MSGILRSARIYWILAFFYWNARIFSFLCLGQIPLEAGDYRSIASGDFEDPANWEVWNGTFWLAAVQKPDASNNVFIDQGNELRLTGDEEVNHLYLFSAADPGPKLNLQNFELQVYGSLRAMRKEGGLFFLNNVSSALGDWIYPETGKIVFKGSSRTVVDRASWSANTTNSRYTVVFDPLPGETLTVNSAFKANSFIIQSGTVIQTVNTMGIPACSTFSFNNQAVFNGVGPYGQLLVEPGATLISDCTAPLEPILRRSNTIPAQLFHLKGGGNLILRGNAPLMDAAIVILEGTVSYQAAAGTQNMIETTFPGSQIPTDYHHLAFRGASEKNLQDEIRITGNLVQEASGIIWDAPTKLTFNGTGIQQILGWTTTVREVEINKASGSILLDSDFSIGGSMLMRSGQLNFNGYDLIINSTGTGELIYEGGSWLNLESFHYLNLPLVLNPSNASLPFEDFFQGGIRMLQLLGNSPGGNLQVRFFEVPGADWDPDFNDLDGTPILYQLNSYFEIFSSNSSPSPLEMRISAENLIVDQVDDIRIVGNGVPAPGTHLLGLDPGWLWARRNLEFSELDGNTFTVGSYRVLSVLPVTWLEEEAQWENGTVRITWSTAAEKKNQKFRILRSKGNIFDFEVIAEVDSKGESQEVQQYHFEYSEKFTVEFVYFQIEQVDQSGNRSHGRVFRLKGWELPLSRDLKIWPNPYQGGGLQIQFPSDWNSMQTMVTLLSAKGNIISTIPLSLLEENIEKLPDGVYLLQFSDGSRSVTEKLLIKR